MSNILSRIKKLEPARENSGFCRCDKEIIIKVVPSADREETPPTYCEMCSKPNRDPFHFTFNFGGEIKVIEPTTGFSREEFEEWQNQHVISRHKTYEEYLAEA